MEKNKIIVNQAFYGEVNRAHGCIEQTIDDPDLTSFLITFTDRPGALTPGVSLNPYLSGRAFSNYYIITKTIPDSSATRAGMVFTHALIFNIDEINFINNFRDVLTHFVESTDHKKDKLRKLQIDRSDTEYYSEKKIQPKYIQQSVSAFLNGISPIFFSGDIQTFTDVIQVLWNSPDKIASRKSLKFRASFTPSDAVDDLTIVSIQKEFLPKWHGQVIIKGESDENVEVTSYSEKLFLGYKEQNPFCDFLRELNVSLSDFQNYGQYEKIFTNYISINDIDDANIIRQDIRLLSKISSSPNNGKKIKEKFVGRLSILIQSKKDSNIKALRNIDWSAFSEGEIKGRDVVSKFIQNEFENSNQKQFQALSELIDLSINEIPKNWWHISISETLNLTFKKQNDSGLKNIWQLMDESQNTLKNVLSIIDSVKDCDLILRRFLPKKLKIETCKTLSVIASKKSWYILHAEILLKYHSLESALETQLKVERELSLANSAGVKFLSEKFTSENLIFLALKLKDKKLIDLSVEVIIKDASLLKNINLTFSCWLEIWTAVVLKTGKIFKGLAHQERAIVFTILDIIIEGKKVDDRLLNLIAETTFSDISEYENRSKIWKLLPFSAKAEFLSSTTESVLRNLQAGEIEADSIESEISDSITSDVRMSQFLNENKYDIDPVLIVYGSFTNMKDSFLADYIYYYRNSISKSQATKLGELVLRNNFNKTARSIYDKANYNNSFTPAYEICQELVSVNWVESMWGSVGSIFSTKESYNSNQTSLTSEQVIRSNLPTVVILTAIKEEYEAVRSHLVDVVELDRNDTSYEMGIFEFNNKEIAKVAIRECGAKNTIASQEAERAIQYFNPDTMLFVGIAGSRKPKDFSIGDVIFPEKVYSYEGGKSEKDSFVARPDFGDITYALKEIAKKERRKEHWKALIKGEWGQDFKADLGIIASGEQLVEHYHSDIGKTLSKYYNDTSAVEMEGFGFATAANRQGRGTSKILIGVVRGISDILEQPTKRGKSKEDDRRPENAKKIASDTAAAFAFWLIFKAYEPKLVK